MIRRKRGLSTLITTLLIILLILVFISMVWAVVRILLQESSETSEIRQKLFEERIVIKDVEIEEDYVDLTLFKRGGKATPFTEEIIYNISLDIVLVSDVSGSMNDDCTRGEPGNWYSCEDNCEECTPCKICDSKKASKDFVIDILNQGMSHRVGLVTYSADIVSTRPLSEDNEYLIDDINSWSVVTFTCICCGINEAVSMLQDSNNEKMIVLMSDGITNFACDPYQYVGDGDPRATGDAEDAAEEASKNDIVIHSVGFGSDPSEIDEVTLQEIAEITDGNYYSAENASELSDVYKQIANISVTRSIPIRTFEYLVLALYDEDGIIHKAKIDFSEVPGPSESKRFIINFDGFNPIITEETIMTRIEIYAVAVTRAGKEVFSHIINFQEF